MYRQKIIDILPELEEIEVRAISTMVDNGLRYAQHVTNKEVY